MDDSDVLINNPNNGHLRRQRMISILCLLSLIVSLLVFWQLRIIGITMTDEACCGVIEHTHTEECMERVLVCGLEENIAYSCGYEDGEEVFPHTHDGNCCEVTVSEANDCEADSPEETGSEDNLYEEARSLRCEISETEIHRHTEECVAAVEHIHSESCYETVYTCGREEHTHTLDCYTDPSADVESQSDWEATLPLLLNDRAADLVSVAKSQLGYRESTRNVVFETGEDGSHTEHGYTRYGAWYGGARQFTHIDNWSAMFASFCLHYAAVPEDAAPQNHGCNTMMQEWKAIGQFGDTGTYSPKFGDLVFLSKSGSSSANSVGIVASVHESGFTAIEGNSNECVEKNAYSFSDAAILGYGILPDIEDEAPADEDGIPGNTAETVAFSEMRSALSWVVETWQRGRIALFASGTIPSRELNYYITGITGAGTTLDLETGHYHTSLRIDFSMLKSTAIDSLNTSTQSFRYDLPGEIILSESLIDGSPYPAYKVGDSSIHAFDYWFKVNPAIPEGQEGHYYLEIKYDYDYLNGVNAEAQITNYIEFNCWISGDEDSGKDGIQVTFEGDYNLDIPPELINEHYDVSANKSGSFISADGDKLRYSITVSSSEGTPGVIALSDKLTYTESSGISSVGTLALVSVTQYPSGSNITSSCTLTPQTADPTAFDMTLPQLSAGESYVVIYEYSINNLPEGAEFTANNEVSATTESEIKTYHDTDTYVIRRTTQPKITKSGVLQSDEFIEWKIVVNPAKGNIAGKILTDAMFGQLNPDDITVENSNNLWNPTTAGVNEYTVWYDETTGAVTGIQFNAVTGSTENTNCYTVTYRTPTNVEFGETATVLNTATFDGENVSSSVGVPGGSVDKVVGSYVSPSGSTPGSITWNVGVNIPSGGIEAGTEFRDVFGISGNNESNAHYMTAQQYNALVTALENEAWWNSMTGLKYTVDGGIFVSGSPVETDRILGYRFEVAADPAGSELMGQRLAWSYTTTASMESSGEAVTIQEYDPSVGYYPKGTLVQWNGWIYQAATYGAAGKDPSENFTIIEGSASQPWYRVGPAGNATDYRSFTNTIHVGEKELTVKKSFSSQVHKYNVTLGENNSFTFNEADAFFYFNETSADTTFRWAVEVDASTADTYRVIDTLPKEVKLVELHVCPANQYNLALWGSEVSFTSDGTEFSASPTGYTVSGSYDASGDNIVDLSITPAAAGKFRVLYVCELDEAYLPGDGERFTYRLGNAVAVAKGNEMIGEADNTITVTTEERKVVTDKSGTLNYTNINGSPVWDKTITYTVNINPHAENLLVNPELDPNDTLHLRDTLSYIYKDSSGTGSATLSLSSISLVDAATNEIVDVEWTARTTVNGNTKISTIEGDVPDERHLILTYTYFVWSTMENGISLHNDVTLEGETFKHSEYEDEHEKEEFDTHAASDYMEYQLIKVDKDSRRPLAGAQFTAYVWALDEGDGSYKWMSLGKTYTSDAEGVVKISPFDKTDDGTQTGIFNNNTAYCVMETTPPFGYILDEGHRPTYYFWISANNATVPDQAPEDFIDRAVDLANTSGQEYVENEREQQEGYLLPETGSAGALFYVLCGSLLMVLSAVLIFRRRRKQERRLSS